ncbi:MAG: zinc-dependent alcohol dehydrogenase family protein [Gemmataceae bacterium]
MKAAVLEQFGEPAEVLQIQDVPKPEPGDGEVRVRMLVSPINPSDLMTARGIYGRRPDLPATPGYEGAGIIDAISPGWIARLRGLKPGKKVAVLKGVGGNWKEYVVLSAKHVVPVGDMPDDQAATFFVNPATSYVMIKEVLKVRPGEWVLQTAAGSSLCGMVRSLARKNSFRVINVVRRPEQAEQLKQAGHTAIAGTGDDIAEQVLQLTNGMGVPHAIDAVGGSTAVGAAKSLAEGGRLLLYGTLSDQPMELSSRVLMAKQSSIEGFWLSEWVQHQSPLRMLRLFRRLRSLIGEGTIYTEVQEFPLDQIQEAVKQAETPGRDKKVVLRIAQA